ncbi:MAG: WD40 repeat domain-containing protein, partial [Pseudomonadota bacterium]
VAVVSLWRERETRVQKERAELREAEARTQRAEAQRVGARAAFVRGDLLEARAMLRSSLETRDSALGRALKWQLDGESLVWRRAVGGKASAVVFSPDGQIVAAVSDDRSIYLVSADTASTRVLRGQKDPLVSVAFSPDGRHLAAGGWAGTIYLWNLSEDSQRVLVGHSDQPSVLVFSPDSRRLASGGFDGTMRLWDVANGSSQQSLLRGHPSSVFRLCFSPDGQLLASGGLDKTIRLWNAANGAAIRTLAGHTGSIRGLAFSPDGKGLASSSWDRTLRLWEVDKGVEVKRMELPSPPSPGSLSYPANHRITVLIPTQTSLDIRTIDPRDSSTSDTAFHLGSALADVRGLALSQDHRLLANTGLDKTVSLWRVGMGATTTKSAGHLGEVMAHAFSPDGTTLTSTGEDGTIRLWDVTSGEESRQITGHGAAVTWVSSRPDGQLLASASKDNTVRLWEARNGKQLVTLTGHEGEVNQVTFSPDGRKLASTSYDTTVRIWDAASGAVLRILRGHSHVVWEASFSPAGDLVASASVDKTVRIWDVASGRELRRLEGHTGPVRSVIFGKDRSQVISAGLDSTVRVWDWQAGTNETLAQQSRVKQVFGHPDGKRVGVFSFDGRLSFLDLPSASVGERFSPDGRLFSPGHTPGTVTVDDLATGLPHWRAPILLPSPPELSSHRGWQRLDRLPSSSSEKSGQPAMEEARQTAGQTAGQTAWRQAISEGARLASLDATSNLLCLAGARSSVELWDTAAGSELFRRTTAPANVASILATPSGCAVLSGEEALVFDRAGTVRRLATEATAIAWQASAVLVAAKGEVASYDDAEGNARGESYKTGPGVTAVTIIDSWLAVGFNEGQIELFPLLAGREKPAFAFAETGTSAVASLLKGPMDTLIAGYADGTLGIWELKNGTSLYHRKLHGPVRHLLLAGAKLYAATEIGDFTVLDLAVLEQPYCELLNRLWSEVPVVWENGAPVARNPPASHRCLRR